MQSFIVSK